MCLRTVGIFGGVIGENIYCCMNKGIKKNEQEKEKKYWDVNERFKECCGGTGGKIIFIAC